MALRDQPYLPLYIQDFLTDEKLIECSASATGVYIRLLCIMHKSEEYGTILLRQKDQQRGQQVENFAYKLAKQMPYDEEEIHSSLHELIEEGVLQIKGSKLLQKRMLEDNNLSLVRAESGKKGGFATAKKLAKHVANTEYEYEYENEDEIIIKKEKKKDKKILYGEFCKLTKEEYDKLINRFTFQITTDYIEKLNNYIGSTGKRYKSHYHTVLNWLNKEGISSKIDKKADPNCNICDGVGYLVAQFNGKKSMCRCLK